MFVFPVLYWYGRRYISRTRCFGFDWIFLFSWVPFRNEFLVPESCFCPLPERPEVKTALLAFFRAYTTGSFQSIASTSDTTVRSVLRVAKWTKLRCWAKTATVGRCTRTRPETGYSTTISMSGGDCRHSKNNLFPSDKIAAFIQYKVTAARRKKTQTDG